MRPEGARVLTRERRRAWRGTAGGRRPTHTVKTTYGRGQKLRDQITAWAEAKAQRDAAAADRTATEAELLAAGLQRGMAEVREILIPAGSSS